jgi:protein-S-isoprenylcysteine O-methyltransferase Ste14
MTILRHIASFLLPVTVLTLVPMSIEDRFIMSFTPLSVLGLILIGAGVGILFFTVRMFILIGKGTLAPWDPTRKLVTASLYGHVRNPMISGVFTTLVGESLLFSSNAIGLWAFLFFIINTVYFIFSEEPGLEKRFGDEYKKYKENVPRWIPRLKPWKPL